MRADRGGFGGLALGEADLGEPDLVEDPAREKPSMIRTATTLDQLTAVVRSRLTRIQRQPALIAGFLGQAGLTLESTPP